MHRVSKMEKEEEGKKEKKPPNLTYTYIVCVPSFMLVVFSLRKLEALYHNMIKIIYFVD